MWTGSTETRGIKKQESSKIGWKELFTNPKGTVEDTQENPEMLRGVENQAEGTTLLLTTSASTMPLDSKEAEEDLSSPFLLSPARIPRE